MKNKQQGFIIPLIIAIIALLAIGGGVYAYHEKSVQEAMTASTTADMNMQDVASTSGSVSNTQLQTILKKNPTSVVASTSVGVSTNINTPVNVPATNITWKTYADTTYGYSISYPSTWIEEDNIVTGSVGRNFCPPELAGTSIDPHGCNTYANNVDKSPDTNAPILLFAYPLNTGSQNSAYTVLGNDALGKYQLELYLANPSYKTIYDQMVASFKILTAVSANWNTYSNSLTGISIKYPSYLGSPVENNDPNLSVRFGDNSSPSKVDLDYIPPSSYNLQTFTTSPYLHAATDTYTYTMIDGKEAAKYDIVFADYARGSEAGDAPTGYTRAIQYGLQDSTGGFVNFVYSKGFTTKASGQAADMSDADIMALSLKVQ